MLTGGYRQDIASTFPDAQLGWGFYLHAGWYMTGARQFAGTPDPLGYHWGRMMSMTRLRWRGAAATGAGTAFRNRHWTTAYADAKHIPISFKANPAVGVTQGAGEQHLSFGHFRYPGGPLRGL